MQTYLYCLLIAVAVYFFIIRAFYISVIDPLVLVTLFSMFGFSVVLFLYVTHAIRPYYFESYLATQIAFWAGLFFYRSLKPHTVVAPVAAVAPGLRETTLIKALYITCPILYIAGQIVTYKVIGIPLFKDSHINVYKDSGGFGLIGRFITVLTPITAFLLVYHLLKPSTTFFSHFYKYFFTIVTLITFLLSGSKGQFMILPNVLFCYILLNAYQFKSYFNKLNKFGAVLIGVGLAFVGITIAVQSQEGNSMSSITNSFAFRMVSSGDAYYFSYPNAQIEKIQYSNASLALFGDLFATLRLIPRESLPDPVGYALFKQFYVADFIAGPNARHNVFGYIYFGFIGSIIFSFIIGFILSYVRNRLFFSLRSGLLFQLLFVILYLQLSAVETDPSMAISNLENFLFIIPFLLVASIPAYVLLKLGSVRARRLSNSF